MKRHRRGDETITLNRAGDSIDNPIVAGVRFRVVVALPGGPTLGYESVRKCWIGRADGTVYRNLTDRIVVAPSGLSASVDVVAEDFEASYPAIENRLHVTGGGSSGGWHLRSSLWFATRPDGFVVLDGYDGEIAEFPLIVPVH